VGGAALHRRREIRERAVGVGERDELVDVAAEVVEATVFGKFHEHLDHQRQQVRDPRVRQDPVDLQRVPDTDPPRQQRITHGRLRVQQPRQLAVVGDPTTGGVHRRPQIGGHRPVPIRPIQPTRLGNGEQCRVVRCVPSRVEFGVADGRVEFVVGEFHVGLEQLGEHDGHAIEHTFASQPLTRGNLHQFARQGPSAAHEAGARPSVDGVGLSPP
jgi:hypothetical protein